jgi:HEAT repeat protein
MTEETMTKRWMAVLLVVLVALPLLAAPKKKEPPPPPMPPEKIDAVFPVFERGTRSGDLRARGLAVFGIGWVPGKAAQSFVLDALKDPQWLVRSHAIAALYLQGDKNWRAPLLDALGDPTLNPEWDLFPVLGVAKPADAASVLLEAVRNPKNSAQTRLVEALVPCTRPFCSEVKVALGKEGNAVLLDRMQATIATAPKEVRLELLRVLLNSGRDQALRTALMVLEAAPEADLQKPLQELFKKSKDKELQLGAAVVLAKLGDGTGGALLNASLAGADRDGRLRILKALAGAPAAADEKSMLALLAVKPGETVDLDYLSAIFDIYHKQGSDKPLPRARMMINEPDPGSRAVGVRFVARFEGPVALKTLHGLVQDGSTLVRLAAVESIADFARIDSVEPLGTALSDVDKNVKIAAIRGLGRINDVSVIRHLTFVVGDPDPEVKQEALKALARVHDPSVVPTLQMGLVDPSVEVRTAALRGMMESDPANGRMYFQSALLWLPPMVIKELAAAMGKEALPYLLEAARTDSLETRMLALQILEGSGPEGIALLQQILAETSHAEVRERVAGFLFKATGAAAIPLTQGWLEQPGNEGLKVRVLDGLGRLRDPVNVPLIEKRLLDTDERVRVAAALALLKVFVKSVPDLDL